jgi:hypothetical protein
MDVKVDVSNVLDGSHHAADNAGSWLRKQLKYPKFKAIIDEFEEHFNCRIDTDDREDPWMQPNKIIFDSNAELVAFLLKWS